MGYRISNRAIPPRFQQYGITPYMFIALFLA